MGNKDQPLEGFAWGAMNEIDPDLEEDMRDLPNMKPPPDINQADMRLSFNNVLRASIYRFGGPEGVAQELKAVYDGTNSDSVRAGIIDKLFRALESYGEDEFIDDAESLEAIEKELKESVTKELMERLPEDLREQVQGYL